MNHTPHGHAALRSLTIRLAVADTPEAVRAAGTLFEGTVTGLELANSITRDQAEALRRDGQHECALAASGLGTAKHHAPPPTHTTLPGLRLALNAVHYGMTGTEARAAIAQLIDDVQHASTPPAAAKAA